MPVRTVLALLIVAALAAGSVVAQERVFTTLTTDQMEQLLKGLNVEFKKSQSKKIDGHFFYDFNLPKNRLGARVYYFQGKDMMIDVALPEQPLEKLNAWNSTRARVTRAAAHKEAKVPFTTLEANLNFAGGVTENAVRRFILDFQEEAIAFDRFLNNKEVAPPMLDQSGDRIFKTLTTEKLEDIMKKMNLVAKKQAFNASIFYDYESPKNYKIRLTNFGNEDLMLNAVFKKVPLDKLNKYNFERKYIRAVLYTQGNVEYTALEASLDCSAGISENMIRHYMITFEEEVQNFIEFINKN